MFVRLCKVPRVFELEIIIIIRTICSFQPYTLLVLQPHPCTVQCIDFSLFPCRIWDDVICSIVTNVACSIFKGYYGWTLETSDSWDLSSTCNAALDWTQVLSLGTVCNRLACGSKTATVLQTITTEVPTSLFAWSWFQLVVSTPLPIIWSLDWNLNLNHTCLGPGIAQPCPHASWLISSPSWVIMIQINKLHKPPQWGWHLVYSYHRPSQLSVYWRHDRVLATCWILKSVP